MNRKTKLFTLIIMIATSSTMLTAQSTTEEIITNFFSTYKKSPQEAVNYVFSTNK
ncbi:exported protein of unknown function [Tenacibaculum sp. 190130A14a]|uniref:Uncharacterized protein n=1 Tax=Tenacibaculum polynesiense TaxID=3137857 RepID=A0ABM9P9V1_9FLAO